MKSNIVRILLITVCVNGIVGKSPVVGENYFTLPTKDAQSCKEVVASNEVQKVTVLGSGTGCQYRVISDSGQAVKVYVNTTSGTKCVKVSSEGKYETLCPSGATNQFSSSSPIEVSADSDTTTSEAPTTAAPDAATEPNTTPADSPNPKPPGDNDQNDQSRDPQKPAAGSQQNQASGTDVQPDEQGESNHQGKKSNEDAVALIPALVRKARANSQTDGSNDVILYYILGEYQRAATALYMSLVS
ncbi:unnamed protein product [Echinostoma caproni]|uniref:Tetratricopeptide repeat protein n=1 Tax=Echinostoma caproni TaxID=27848 RepID=A0A183AN58_9TREM|nr:unnamed protein product [Echinostoma caproni]